MSNDTIIADKIAEFTDKELAFTSVDVANSIKSDGTWIRNREVAAYLRRWTPILGYCISRVTVTLENGGTTTAAVYLPVTLSVADYAETAQRAMTPAEFEQIHGTNPTASVIAVDAIDDDGDDGDDGSLSHTVGDRLRAMFKWPSSGS